MYDVAILYHGVPLTDRTIDASFRYSVRRSATSIPRDLHLKNIVFKTYRNMTKVINIYCLKTCIFEQFYPAH